MTNFKVEAKPIPSNFLGTPEQLAQAWVDRMNIVTKNSTFVISDTQPTADDGPWFKNGKQLWVWNGVTYVPLDVSASTLPQIWVSDVAPDVTKYTLWLEVYAGVVLGFHAYVSGAWRTRDFSQAPGSVTTAMLAESAVTAAKLADASVTSAKLAAPIPLAKWQGGAANQFARMDAAGANPVWSDTRLVSPAQLLTLGVNEFTHGLPKTPHLVQAFVYSTADIHTGTGDLLWTANQLIDAGNFLGSTLLVKTDTKVQLRMHSAFPITLQRGYFVYPIASLANWRLKFFITPA